jgi:hypothetical protein
MIGDTGHFNLYLYSFNFCCTDSQGSLTSISIIYLTHIHCFLLASSITEKKIVLPAHEATGQLLDYKILVFI